MSKLSIVCTTEMSLFDASTSNRDSKSDDVVSIRVSNSPSGPPRNVKVFSRMSGVLISVSVLRDGEVSPVGTSHPIKTANVRAATAAADQLVCEVDMARNEFRRGETGLMRAEAPVRKRQAVVLRREKNAAPERSKFGDARQRPDLALHWSQESHQDGHPPSFDGLLS